MRARGRGLGIAVRDLFRSQTIRELSAVVHSLETPTAVIGSASGLSESELDLLKVRLRERARSKKRGKTP